MLLRVLGVRSLVHRFKTWELERLRRRRIMRTVGSRVVWYGVVELGVVKKQEEIKEHEDVKGQEEIKEQGGVTTEQEDISDKDTSSTELKHWDVVLQGERERNVDDTTG
jgi:hypothetical protein